MTPGSGSPRPPLRSLVSLALFAACAVALALSAWTWDRNTIGVAWDAYATPQKLFLNVFPGLLIALVLVAITRRVVLSFLLVGLLHFLLYYIGRIKLEALQDPIGLQDFFFLSGLDASSAKLFWRYVPHQWFFVAIGFGAIAVAAAIWCLEPPSLRRLGAVRLLALSLPLVFFGLFAGAKWPWDRLYTAQALMASRFDEITAILHGGQVSDLVYAYVRNKKIAHAVDRESIDWLLDHAPEREILPVPGGKPDVVIVLSESFFDPHVLKGMQAVPDSMPNVRAAIEGGHGGYMRVPTFGGGTIRTEFEILTGMPIGAFPEARFPYTSLVRDRIPGLVRLLKSDGYRTIAIHGNSGAFWNRNNAFKAIGFDRFITEREFPESAERNGNWISDKAMTDLVVRELSNEQGPTLVFAISMEAHGPYTAVDFQGSGQRNAIPVPPGLESTEALVLRNYLYHQRNADHEFGRLLRVLQQRGRPTVFLFFGDHLPGFPSIMNKMGTADRRPVKKQLVPWVLLRTDMPDFHLGGNRLSWMLPGEVAELAGAPEDDYFALTQQLSQASRANPAYLRGKIGDGINAAATARLGGSFEAAINAHRNALARKSVAQ